jgi:hypothetical protein
MSRQITVTDELAEALENAASRNEEGEQSMTGLGSTAASVLGSGLLSLLPMVLSLLTTLVQTMGKGNALALLQALPALFAAVQAGDWNKVIEIISTAFNIPKPTKAVVIGSMPDA